MRDGYKQQAFLDVQGARIARWIRESEAGWLFYGPDGRAWHITASEAAAFEAEAMALVLVLRAKAQGFLGFPGWGATGTILAVWFVLAIPLFLIVAVANDIAYEIALRR
jgi:hypothetical protein